MSDAALTVVVDTHRDQQALPTLDEESGNLREFAPEWPKQLEFLRNFECNPNFEDKTLQKIGHVRRASLLERKEKEDTAKRRSRLDAVRMVTAMLVNSWTFQSLVMGVIFFDLLLTIYAFVDEETDSHIFEAGDYLVLVVLTYDVLARFFVSGRTFLYGCLNVFELFLVPVTFCEIYFLGNVNIPVQMLRVIRPIFRGFRLVRILVRTASKTDRYLVHLRHQVSGDRLRFMQDGFDLDLAYVTNQIIVMSCPAIGRNSWFHNPLSEVARFFNERHTNRYLILNTTEYRDYPLQPFFYRYHAFPMLKDGVPRLDAIWDLCKDLDAWLQMHPKHLLAVHSKHGQGRASLVVMALLIFTGVVRTPASAIRFYEYSRSHPESPSVVMVQSCDCASQRRFLEYFARMCHERRLGHSKVPPREVRLTSIELCGLPGMQSIDVACFGNVVQTIDVASQPVKAGDRDSEADEPQEPFREKEKTSMKEHIQSLIDEATYDSLKSGGRPAVADPLFCSITTPGAMRRKSLAYQAGGLAPGIWEMEPIRLCGEIKIEISRRKLTAEAKQDLDTFTVPSRKDFKSMARGGSRADKLGFTDELKGPNFEHGLMLCCWLHTDYLEQDEEKNSGRGRKHQKKLTVSIDRFGLDKAANAPRLKSHPESLELKLIFEVDERRDLIPLEEVSKQNQQVFFSRLETSKPETIGWLTFVGKKIWPNFEMIFRKIFEDNLISLLKESLPAPLNETVALRSFSLGDEFPKFGPIVASSKHHNRGKQVQLNVELDYATETDVIIELSYAAFGITKLSIKGTLCLKFKPLLNEIPVLSAMQLFFLETPLIHIWFGKALAIANFSMVSNAIHRQIREGLDSILVLPNVMNINWGDPEATSDSAVTFDTEFPCSVLRIGIGGARNLKADCSLLWRAPDSFVKVSVGKNVAESKAVPQSTNPTFDEEFDFVVYDECQHVMCRVYDRGITGSHNFIGAVPTGITVMDFALAGKQGSWIDLVGTPEKVKSEIQISAQIFDLNNDAEKLRNLFEDLRQADDTSKSPSKSMASASTSRHSGSSPSKSKRAGKGRGIREDLTSGSCMMLACQVLGGKTPPSDMPPDHIAVQVKFGSASKKQNCAPYPESTTMVNEKLKAAIHKLDDLKYDDEAIADILQESLEDVRYALRGKQFNMLCPQKIFVLAKRHEIASVTDAQFAILDRKTEAELCVGTLPIEHILSNSDACKKGRVACKDARGMRLAELHVEVRLFLLQAVERPIDAERPAEGGEELHQESFTSL
eukprot:TRINITY_DN14753_c0_g2_i1.p1 TRINITY_DN14753_c0_g2~~TRINITY_DN14753_c0_g2_i1.p1  ORF type:complete len:1269 (+),score=206.43 TRINITY_DN14753_c0_g2_i1:50-3856(+)